MNRQARPDGPVVNALLAAGLTVVVISPNQVRNLRGRPGAVGLLLHRALTNQGEAA